MLHVHINDLGKHIFTCILWCLREDCIDPPKNNHIKTDWNQKTACGVSTGCTNDLLSQTGFGIVFVVLCYEMFLCFSQTREQIGLWTLFCFLSGAGIKSEHCVPSCFIMSSFENVLYTVLCITNMFYSNLTQRWAVELFWFWLPTQDTNSAQTTGSAIKNDVKLCVCIIHFCIYLFLYLYGHIYEGK